MDSVSATQQAEEAAHRVRTAADSLWQVQLENPLARMGIGLQVTSIPEGSRDEALKLASRAESMLQSLAGLDEGLLAETDRLTLGFLRHELQQAKEAEATWLHGSPVTPYSNMHYAYMAQNILAKDCVESPESLERVARLWSDLSAALRQVPVRLAAQADLGRRLPQPALAPTAEAWRRMRDALVGILDQSRVSSAAPWTARWAAEADRIRDKELLPALEAVIGVLGDPDYAASAPAQVGLVHQPGGYDEYQRLLVKHLTQVDDSVRIHRVGHNEVKRLSDCMAEVRSRLGYNGSEQDFHARLKTDPRVIAKTPEEVAERYMRCMARIEPVLPQWFSRLPISPYAVRRLPLEQEAGMAYGYYDKPNQVGQRGVYLFNASNLEQRSQLQVAALIYHELAPGHHFHLARQMELDHLPLVRSNSLELSVFNEGWAEYASGLAGEMGLYDDLYDLYGRLAHERFIAQRLVVDTGMNALAWSLDEARAFMRNNTMEGEAQIASETLRYSTDMPAQALAYRLGYLAFMKLRDDAKTRRGAAFDIREYHEAILGEGALPLPVLQAHLERVLPRNV